MRGPRRRGIVVAFVLCLLWADSVKAQPVPYFTSVTSDVNHTTLILRGDNFCASPNVIVPALSLTPLTQVGASSATTMTVAYPPAAAGLYLFAMQCGTTFTYYVLTLEPQGGGATLASNTFNGNQNINGTLHVTGDTVVDGNIAAKYQDVAEWVDTAESMTPGMVVVIDTAGRNRVVASTRAYATSVAGAVSAQPGIVLGERGAGRVLVAQSGRVRIKADARYGAIKAGDLLVSSPTAGHAMRSEPLRVGKQLMHRPGTILGKALEDLAAGQGEILVLLTLQ